MRTFKHITVLFFCSCFAFVSKDIYAQAKASNAIQGTYKSIYDMLKDVPGLDVKTDNSGGGSITVRGAGSLTRQGQPLFVLDGSIIDSRGVGGLNPQDIDAINVLKDAASTTAYGAQGMFGVIVITTKKGTITTAGTAKVSNHTESAYTYFIDHKTPLKVYDMNDNVIVEGVIQKQQGDSLVFTKKRKDFFVAISGIKRVEMIPQ